LISYEEHDLVVGERIDIEVEEPDGFLKSYPSKVYDILDSTHIVLAGPIEKGKIVLISIGQSARIVYYREDGYYRLYGIIEKRYKADKDIFLYVFNFNGFKEKIQRRNYFRLKIILPVYFRKITADEEVADNPIHKAYTLDISGGGMRIAVPKKISLKEGDILQCLVSLENSDINIKGEVVRISSSAENNMMEVGIAFRDIHPNVQDRLIAFIFKQQLKIIQKGLP